MPQPGAGALRRAVHQVQRLVRARAPDTCRPSPAPSTGRCRRSLAVRADLDAGRPAVGGQPADHGVGVHHPSAPIIWLRVELRVVLADRLQTGAAAFFAASSLTGSPASAAAAGRADASRSGSCRCPAAYRLNVQVPGACSFTRSTAPSRPRRRPPSRPRPRPRRARHAERLRQPGHLGGRDLALRPVHRRRGGAVGQRAVGPVGHAAGRARRGRCRPARARRRTRPGRAAGEPVARRRGARRPPVAAGRGRRPVRTAAPGQQHRCRHRGDDKTGRRPRGGPALPPAVRGVSGQRRRRGFSASVSLPSPFPLYTCRGPRRAPPCRAPSPAAAGRAARPGRCRRPPTGGLRRPSSLSGRSVTHRIAPSSASRRMAPGRYVTSPGAQPRNGRGA